jgi:DNA-binding transcriptional MerR regulator
MPRIVKSLPENRADCSFGDLVYWHLFERGTRPDGDPSAKIGRIWGLKEASAKLGISERALRYWLADKHLPDSIAPLERVLFGNSPVFDDWRLELVGALRKTRLGNVAKASAASGKPPAKPVTGGAVVRFEVGPDPDEEGPEDEEAEYEIVPAQHVFKDEPVRNSRGEIVVPPPEILYAKRKAQPPPPPRAPRQKRNAAIVVVGITTLLGLYAWASNRPKDTYVVTELGKKDDKPPVPVTPTPASKDPPQVPALSPAEKAKREAEDRAEAQRQAQLKATRDAVESRKNEQEAAARALNEKLKILAQAEGDLCKQKLQGLDVPGFTLKCDTLVPFGKLLGTVPVSQTASSLGDCAARCRKAETPRCVAFSFDAGAHVGSASCYLTGSIPGYNAAPNWIAGVR